MATRFRYILILLYFAISCVPSFAQSDAVMARLDSLYSVLAHTKDKNHEAELYNAVALAHYSVDSTGFYAKKAIDIAHEVGNWRVEVSSYGLLAWSEFHNSNYVESCRYAQQGLVIADSIGDKKSIALQSYYLGNAFGVLNDFNTAINYYARSLDLCEELNNTKLKCIVLRNMANVEYSNMLFDEAREHIVISKGIAHQEHDIDGLSDDYFMLGEIAYNKYNYQKYSKADVSLIDEAKKNYQKGLEYAESANNDYSYLHTSVYYTNALLEEAKLASSKEERTAKLDSCKAFIDKGLESSLKYGYEREARLLNAEYCLWLAMSGKYNQAKAKLDSLASFFLSNEKNYVEEIMLIYDYYSEYYKAIGNYNMALKYTNMLHERRYNNRQADFVANAARSMMVGEYNMKLRERDIRYDADMKQRRVVTVSILVILAFVIILTIVLIRSNLHRRRDNRKLDQKNIELEQQKEEMLAQNERLEEQRNLVAQANSLITDSINYASLIQGAAMPNEQLLTDLIGEHFVIFKPKDIVSGDFYWAIEHDGLVMFAVADCTGHGVPGAFVSMLGISILNDLAAKISVDNISAGAILDELRSRLICALHQSSINNENRDGMDIGILIFDKANNETHYAGAYRPLVIWHDNKMTKIEADHMPIGIYAGEIKPFTNHKMTIQPNDMLYLYTDGIVDQFGYDKVKGKESKFTVRRLNSLLNKINSLPCKEQRREIEQAINNWRNGSPGMASEQTDDNLIVGIRIR